MTVGELRATLAGLPGELEVRGGSFDLVAFYERGNWVGGVSARDGGLRLVEKPLVEKRVAG